MMKVHLVAIVLLAQLSFAFPRRKVTIDAAKIDTEAVTVDTSIDKNAFGTCMCDLTRNACDAYCCCDEDCGAAILAVWKSDYDNVCAKNYIGQAFKPAQKCISSKQLYKYNQRMGMSVEDKQGLFCVEMDAASPTSSYQEHVKVIAEGTTLQNLENLDMTATLYDSRGYNDKFGTPDAFNYLDEMLSMKGNTYENFLLPQRDLFGFCDNYKSASFLKNVDPE